MIKNFFSTDLIGNTGKGILTLLNDEVKMRASLNFAETVYTQWPTSPVLIKKSPLLSTSFTIKHYASEVTYNTV